MTMALFVIKTGRLIPLRYLDTSDDWGLGRQRREEWVGSCGWEKGDLHTLKICKLRLFPSIYREDGHS